MVRSARQCRAGASYYIRARGVSGDLVFLDDAERGRFLGLLGRATKRFQVTIRAFCLLDDEYHLFITAARANLGGFMRWLNASYTKDVNASRGRSGGLFRDRFVSVPAGDKDGWIDLSLLIHLLPTRRGLVALPAHYEWSSFRDYSFAEPRREWLGHREVMRHIDGDNLARRRAYNAMAQDLAGADEKHWRKILARVRKSGPASTSSDPIATNDANEGGKLMEEIEALADAFGVQTRDLLRRRRSFTPRLAAYHYLVEMAGFEASAVARAMGVKKPAVSMGLARFESSLGDDPEIKAILEGLASRNDAD